MPTSITWLMALVPSLTMGLCSCNGLRSGSSNCILSFNAVVASLLTVNFPFLFGDALIISMPLFALLRGHHFC
ncbi:hypothetical protein Taro_007400 [Colocasia esculenta]|uniref:Secreted peptide n=1 Tax=Colocasia esculenta TaxID=4460 RepID=A0A843TY17_COLES|nr:hypothetical protein [Colocasia esculenta]